MKIIELTRRQVTIVDDDVYEWASKFKWYAFNSRGVFYAARSDHKLRKTIFLHKEIMRPGEGLEVGHIAGGGLDNQRKNLRVVTHQQNAHGFRKPKMDGYRGVYWHRSVQKWVAQIRKRKRFYLGSFESKEDAARAYDAKARELFGEHAAPNFPLTTADA